MKRAALHNHSHMSNFRLIDAITRPDELIETADSLKFNALAITEHETVASAVQMLKEFKRLTDEGKLKHVDKIILGNEAYLVDSLEEVRDNYQSGVTRFPHFILMAKNRKGFELLSKLSSIAWSNSFFTGLMERTVTEKHVLRDELNKPEYKGTIMATSTCIGSNINIPLLKALESEEVGDNAQRDKYIMDAESELNWCLETFGKEDFYIELQPAATKEQKYCNLKLIEFGKKHNLKYCLANDTHYARPEKRDLHRTFLNSKEGDRETDRFYYHCYMHSYEEMKEKMHYIDDEIFKLAMKGNDEIYHKVENYEIKHEPIIPKSTIPEFELKHLFKPAYDKYDSLKYLAYSEHEDDRYLLYLLEVGYLNELHEKGITKEKFHKILKRLDDEASEIIGVGQVLNQTMSSYYLTCREIVNIMWRDDEYGGQSIVGSGRGSGAGFLINYLLGITQINPLEYYNLPHKRHLAKERASSGLPKHLLGIKCERKTKRCMYQ